MKMTFACVSAFVVATACLPVRAFASPPEDEEAEVVIVEATRSGRRVQDEPIRVEVINREEIEEKILMTPGNISTLVAETGGLRVQVTSPALGASNVRVRGLEGRYTQMLADGLPLYGSSSGIGLLQIAPTDLGRVEVIKGAASALYGPSALGGVINLVSRRWRDENSSEILINATSRNGQDVTGFSAVKLSDTASMTLTAGVHVQERQDLDHDGWSDMPGYQRQTLRPRFFWENEQGHSAFLTVGLMGENREGGTEPSRTLASGLPFAQNQRSQRLDAGIVYEQPVLSNSKLHVRGSAVSQNHRHTFGMTIERDRHDSAFGEVSLSQNKGGLSWLVGTAVQQDRFQSKTFPALNYDYMVPALFAQVERDLTPEITIAGSARTDFHSEFGNFFSPRLSVLYRPEHWTIRASAGRGFFAPTPFVDEIEAAGLSRLDPLRNLKAELADTASFDVGYKLGTTEINVSLFGAIVQDAVRLKTNSAGTRVALVNETGDTRTSGVELLVRQRWDDFTITASYVQIPSSEPNDSRTARQSLARTPRNTGGMVAMWEKEGKGRLGFEVYYTGRQRLEDNPYRLNSRPYVEMGLLGEMVVGKFRLFLNGENLLNVRQTKYDPLPLRTRAADGRWTVDAWAPLDGFVLNGGIKISFGA